MADPAYICIYSTVLRSAEAQESVPIHSLSGHSPEMYSRGLAGCGVRAPLGGINGQTTPMRESLDGKKVARQGTELLINVAWEQLVGGCSLCLGIDR